MEIEVGNSPDPVAPAQPVAAVPAAPDSTGSAAHLAASEKRDFGAYLEARQAEDIGHPLARKADEPVAAVAAKADAPAAVPDPALVPERTTSKRQEQINELHRSNAALRAENARLVAASAGRVAPAVEPARRTLAPAGDVEPQPTDRNADGTEKYPLGEIDAKFIRDLTAHTSRTEFARLQREADEQRSLSTRAEAAAKEVDTFRSKFREAATADPAFVAKIPIEVANALVPSSELHGAPATALTVLTDELVRSEYWREWLEHLSDNPATFHRLATARDPESLMRDYWRIEAGFEVAKQTAPPEPPQLTRTPNPPKHVLGNQPGGPVDPKEAARSRRDFNAYAAAREADDLAIVKGRKAR